jgi:hypothetical protein
MVLLRGPSSAAPDTKAVLVPTSAKVRWPFLTWNCLRKHLLTLCRLHALYLIDSHEPPGVRIVLQGHLRCPPSGRRNQHQCPARLYWRLEPWCRHWSLHLLDVLREWEHLLLNSKCNMPVYCVVFAYIFVIPCLYRTFSWKRIETFSNICQV